MPIQQVQNSFNYLDLQEIASINKGSPKTERKSGRDLDHFRVEFNEEFEQYRDIFVQLYGEKPTRFSRVLFTAESSQHAFPHWYEIWGRGVLAVRCDGERQVYGRSKGSACQRNAEKKCDCKPTGRMWLRFLDFEEATGVVGSFYVRTTSIQDIYNLYNVLKTTEVIYGTLWGIEFEFGRKPQPAVTRIKGEQKPTTKNLLYLQVVHNPHLPVRQSAKPDTAQQDGFETHWTAKPDRTEAFLQWAKETFNMSPEDVLIALKNYDDIVTVISDFPGEQGEAAAAVVASHYEYNPSAIQSTDTVKDNIKALALELAAVHADAAEAEALPDEAEDVEEVDYVLD